VRANLPGRGVALLATLAVLVVACSDAEPTPLQNVGGGWHVVPADAMSLGVSNGTTLTITLAVDGEVVRTLAPGAVAEAIPASALPALPWVVEARSPSGRLLTSMTVKAGDVLRAEAPVEGGFVSKGPWTSAVLSCGRVDIWSWSGPPPPPPTGPASGSPGDCAP
jgi:hypothetical protein